MKALSLWQPFATLVALGAKQYETRSWQTSYRGPIVIHAAKHSEDLRHWYRQPWFYEVLVMNGYSTLEHLPLGKALCVVDLVDIRQVETMRDTLSEREEAFGNYGDGRFAWTLLNPRCFKEPIPMRGAQGLFDCTLPESLP